MTWKEAGKKILFPHRALFLVLLPVSACLLISAMCTLEERNPVRIVSYVLAFYTLIVWCVRLPRIIRRCAAFHRSNRHIRRWSGDIHLRLRVTLCINFLWNGAYALLLLGLGVRHTSAWFISLAAYYASLAVMRFSLAHHALRHPPGKNMVQELKIYRACGLIFLVMNLALSGMMLHMIRQEAMVRHHEITAIAMAAYTFTSLTAAIVNVIRYRKYRSPVLSAAKLITLSAACVSMLTLERTMLSTFRTDSMTAQTQLLFLALSGGAVSALILAMAVHMVVSATRQIKTLEISYGNEQNL